MSFQDNLKKYREAAGFKLAKDFAKIMGIPYSTYIGYETNGREPKYETLIRIAAVLHVSTDELLGYNPDDELQAAVNDIRSSGLKIDIVQQDAEQIARINLLSDLDADKAQSFGFTITLKLDAFVSICHMVRNSSDYKDAVAKAKKDAYENAFMGAYFKSRGITQAALEKGVDIKFGQDGRMEIAEAPTKSSTTKVKK